MSPFVFLKALLILSLFADEKACLINPILHSVGRISSENVVPSPVKLNAFTLNIPS